MFHQKKLYQILSIIFVLLFATFPVQATDTESTDFLTLSAHSAVLMDQSTGTILFEKNSHEVLAPASVTKIMTILLVMDALQRGDITKEDIVTTSDNAAGMGGSQVYLKSGEQMPLWEMLKCVVVVSGNDASVALAEHLAGSEERFVTQMNEKAQQIGMTNTVFLNCTGLPEDGHVTTAYDIALMSQELLKNHPEITELTTIWMDSIRDGEFGLTNTNRLIYSYPNATGLKTGSTDEALYCISASASNGSLDLISVILKAPTSTNRFTDAQMLLDYGFATFTLEEIYPSTPIAPIPIKLGTTEFLQVKLEPITLLLEKSKSQDITTQVNLPNQIEAPIPQGATIGTFDIYISGERIESIPISTVIEIPRLSLLGIFQKLCQKAMISSV